MALKNKKKILFGSVAFGVLFLLCLTLRNAGVFTGQEQSLSALLYHARPVSSDIVIVAIDAKSVSSPEQGGLDGFQSYAKEYYADVLSKIEGGKPSSVFFDVLFSSASDGINSEGLLSILKDSTDSSDFAEKTLAYAQDPHPYDEYFANVLSQFKNVFLLKSSLGAVNWNGNSFDVETEMPPLSLLADQAHVAFTKVIDNEDSQSSSMVFAIPTLFSTQNGTEKHIDLQLAEAFAGKDPTSGIPTEKGQMLINYAAPSYSYEMVSFADVYYDRVDPSIFANKIVLVGATAAILQDRQFTPIDQTRPTPGIEIHANAIQTLLDGDFLRYQSTGEFAGMMGLMLMVSVLSFLFLPVLAGTGVFVLELVAFPFLARWAFDHGIILDLIWPVFGLVLAYLVVLAYRNLTEFAEKRKLREAFSHYVAPELVSQITEHPELLALGGEKRVITAFFLDIENFTHLSEGLSPQEVVKLINLYFDALSKVIMAHGGTVDKFEGDAIMALFGAPVPSEDHAVKACAAALAIREKMAELNAASGRTLNVRIGLATGEAIVGNMGSENRFDYTAMGDTVNTASRLEGANKFYGTKILVTQGTFEAAQSAIFFRRVDTVRLKGKDTPVHLYEVLGTEAGASPEGKSLVNDWHSALEFYKAGDWAAAEKAMQAVLLRLPNDGPAETLLARIPELKRLHQEGPTGFHSVWDGVWTFDSK